MNLCDIGDLALIVGKDQKQFLIRIDRDQQLQTHRGVLKHADLIGQPWGSRVVGHTGEPFTIFKPTLRDLLLRTKRTSQIIFPKDIGYILLRLSVGPGSNVVEAGTGSGALTTALAWAVGPQGHVYSYDRREDMQALARKNLERLSLQDRVSFRLTDIRDGFEESQIASLFMDMPQPHSYLEQAHSALASGGTFGAIVPTANQVSDLLRAFKRARFGLAEVCEILLRFYKTVPDRLRPDDRMVAHTGFLVFARSLHESQDGDQVDAPTSTARSQAGEDGEVEP